MYNCFCCCCLLSCVCTLLFSCSTHHTRSFISSSPLFCVVRSCLWCGQTWSCHFSHHVEWIFVRFFIHIYIKNTFHLPPRAAALKTTYIFSVLFAHIRVLPHHFCIQNRIHLILSFEKKNFFFYIYNTPHKVTYYIFLQSKYFIHTRYNLDLCIE